MKNKIIKLVQKQGFIIFLFAGVCIMAGVTLYISTRSLNVAEEDIEDDNELVILDEEKVKESSSYNNEFNIEDLADLEIGFAYSDDVQGEEIEEIEKNEEAEEIEETKEVALVESDSSEDKIAEVEELEFEEENFEDSYLVEETKLAILPLEGEIITEYTEQSLIYSQTLDAWVGHGAIDIKGEEGTSVLAIMDGQIKQVYEDDLWGIVIIIEHEDGIESRYSNLGTMEMVKEGLEVKKGDHISKIGKTAKIEMHMDPHLHFEVRKNGKIIDPRSIID